MALFTLDAATMTTNLLPNQPTGGLFFILPQECFHQVTVPKAFTMLPSRSSTPRPRRRPIIPQPSASQIAMQSKGLELTLNSRKSSPANPTHSTERSHVRTIVAIDAPPTSPVVQQVERTSSVYSTESAHSSDSVETTISQIVEMYTDLISKIPRFETSEVNILQPKAYRDTVAPLLQRRFSMERQEPYEMSLPSTNTVLPANKSLGAPLKTPHRKVPGFQEFSQNLKDRRAEMVSPLSAASSEYAQMSAIDDISEPSPATSRIRPFSFTSEDQSNSRDQRLVSSSASEDLNQTPRSRSEPKTPDEASPPPHQSVSHLQQPSQRTLRYIESKDIFDLQRQDRGDHSLNSAQSLQAEHSSDRFYRNRSTGSASTDSFVIYTGLGETMKAMIKEKMTRRKNGKDVANIMTSASQKYPVMEQEQRRQSKEQRRSSLSNGVNSVLRKASLKEPANDNLISGSYPAKESIAAIPLTPYQKYGIEAWTVKNKKKRREERQKEREGQLEKEASIPERKEQKHTPNQTVSPKMSSTAASKGSHGRKNSLMVALEGARSSLTYTSAEKRREKLKESIVLVGPTQLTYTSASANGGIVNESG